MERGNKPWGRDGRVRSIVGSSIQPRQRGVLTRAPTRVLVNVPRDYHKTQGKVKENQRGEVKVAEGCACVENCMVVEGCLVLEIVRLVTEELVVDSERPGYIKHREGIYVVSWSLT